jgi:hypothetical protein
MRSLKVAYIHSETSNDDSIIKERTYRFLFRARDFVGLIDPSRLDAATTFRRRSERHAELQVYRTGSQRARFRL